MVINKLELSIPLGPAYCLSSLKKAGFECEIFEISTSSLGELVRYRPSAVLFSVYSGAQGPALAFNRAIRNRVKTISVFGGPHPTFFPELIREEGVDAVCRGEGELALTEFLERFRGEGVVPEGVANFVVRHGERLDETPPRPLVEDLDSLPWPDRSAFIRRFPLLGVHKVKSFVAHRGCPYRCSYCFNASFNRLYAPHEGSIYRSRDPENICDEIDYERRSMSIRMVCFIDDVFTLDSAWTLKFCELYGRRIGLPFQANVRLDNLDDARIEALVSAGCHLLHVGVESGDEDLRRDLLGRKMPDNFIVDAIRKLRRRGIKVLTENIVGYPGERFDQAWKTLELNLRAGPDYGNASVFIPYPRLELTERARREGYYDGDARTLPVGYHHRSPLKFGSRTERNMIHNLSCFFSLLVRHPGLIPFSKAVLRLPPNRLFYFLGGALDGYYLRKLLPYRLTLGEYAKLVAVFFRGYRKLFRGKLNIHE